MTLSDNTSGETGVAFGRDLKAELSETVKSLKEVTLMIEQSQGEVNKLTQRNAAITAHLQKVQSQAVAVSADEIRMAYDSALDAQQRLFVMRGQLEKLQNDKTHLTQVEALLKFMQDMSASTPGKPSQPAKSGLASVEMLVNAQEAERQRLSRQMHDGPAQALSNFILQAEIAMRLLDIDAGKAREELSNLKASAMSTFQKVRNFIFELRPMMLDDLGLAPTIKKYAENFKEQFGLDVNISISGNDRRLEPYLEVMIFRALQELLGNAARHSQATLVKVHVDMGEAAVKVSVDDNGRGFDPDLAENSLGIKLIRERCEMLGGTFELDTVIGKGTRITFLLPARA